MYQVRYAGKTHRFDGLHAEDLLCRRWSKSQQFYELDLLEQIAAQRRSGIYVDAGANLGNHSVFFMHHCPATCVIAVEAHPAIYCVLQQNLAANPAAVSAVSHNVCLAAIARGTAQLSAIDPGNVGATRVVSIGDAGTGTRVATQTLDELLAGAAPVACLKIDCEGTDAAVLAGARAVLAAHRPLVAVEAADQLARDAVSRLLSPLGYALRFRTRKRQASWLWVA